MFLVALGIDYNIFLMTRVREEANRRDALHGALTGAPYIDYSPPCRTGIPAFAGWGSCFTAGRTREDPECLTSAPPASPGLPPTRPEPARRYRFMS